jgi:hypothetical protein
MRLATPALSLTRWLCYAGSLADSAARATAGILVASRGGAAHPCGAVCYQQDRHPQYGKILCAEHFIALDALFPEAVLAALLTGLDGVAALLGCSAIRSVVSTRPARSSKARPMPDEALLEELQTAGYRPSGLTLLKPTAKYLDDLQAEAEATVRP